MNSQNKPVVEPIQYIYGGLIDPGYLVRNVLKSTEFLRYKSNTKCLDIHDTFKHTYIRIRKL